MIFERVLGRIGDSGLRFEGLTDRLLDGSCGRRSDRPCVVRANRRLAAPVYLPAFRLLIVFAFSFDNRTRFARISSSYR